uniref:Uncharacterized protein n=1 Tax=Chenopodium quinoa TaxID=63459 RepID=A0A803L0T5_CHEQI
MSSRIPKVRSRFSLRVVEKRGTVVLEMKLVTKAESLMTLALKDDFVKMAGFPASVFTHVPGKGQKVENCPKGFILFFRYPFTETGLGFPFRFEVTFNGFCQPIRKGGSILVKFISSIAKKDDICPIRDVNWQNVNKTMLGDIVNLICEKFIIPDGKIYDDAMLKHVGKHRRQWKFELKAKYFNPTIRTRTQIEKDRPGGIVRENWLLLVEYWLSNKSKNYSEIGIEARASLGYLHTNGATSFANSRDEFV